MSLVVAGTAERTEIFNIVRPTTGQRKYVMYLRRRCEPSGLKAVFAEWICSDILFTDFLPCTMILADNFGITMIFIILPILDYPMLLTVLPGCKVRTSRTGTGF